MKKCTLYCEKREKLADGRREETDHTNTPSAFCRGVKTDFAKNTQFRLLILPFLP